MCGLLTRGLLIGHLQRLSGVRAQYFCSGASRPDGAAAPTRSWEVVVPRNSKHSTDDTGLSDIVRGRSVEAYFLKSSIISTVLRVFSSRLFWLHRSTSRFTSCCPVSLSYDVYDGKDDGVPLVFLHGLFGSKSNFHSIAKSLVQRTGRKVLTVDARNHGNSIHSPSLTYEAMTNDLKHLLNQLHIGKCILIGHSMGGKTAMATALSQPSLVERLVVVDISPVPTSARTFMKGYIDAMKEVKIPSNIPRSTARRVAEDQLRKHVKERSVRHFLLTNLVEQNGHYAWRINLEAISNHLTDLMGFPKFNTTYDGPTLFLGGSSSEYVSSEDYDEIQRLFPCADIQYIPDASHWIHADKPLEFISSIITFVQS